MSLSPASAGGIHRNSCFTFIVKFSRLHLNGGVGKVTATCGVAKKRREEMEHELELLILPSALR